MFSKEDIQWIKGVNNPFGGWAYMEDDYEFKMHFPARNSRNASGPSPGELILLHQNPRLSRLHRTYLTHLVTPVDNLVREDLNEPQFPWYRKVAIVAKPPMYDLLTNQFLKDLGVSMRNYGYGDARDISGLPGAEQLDIQEIVWNELNRFVSLSNVNRIASYFGQFEPEDGELGNTSGVTEGALKEALRKHKYYERDRSIIIDKKNAVLQAKGRLDCECCDTNFETYYGSIGEGFIECHHIFPIGSGVERVTELSDLALVCANCHRMLHRRRDNGTYHSVKSLRNLIQLQNN